MKNLEQLKFRLELSKLKYKSDFEKAFSDSTFTVRFIEFIQGKIGILWLKNNKSKLFHEWQNSDGK